MRMTKPNIALTALTLIIIVFIAIAASQWRSGGNRGTTDIIVDTVYIDTIPKQSAKKQNIKKSKKKLPKENARHKLDTNRLKPSQRDYLSEPLN